MKKNNYIVTNANLAVANIAYKTNELFPIYPITPTTEMAEEVEKWNALGDKNVFNAPTIVKQLQSEAGVAGTMHGSLQAGSLTTTFTSSQGLLLMIPNMHRIAGELLPNVIHVATRSVATHALSIFSDHSDIMAARNTGYAFLASTSVQEAHDMALISQAASLASNIPFVHFFDGFRTSHEFNCIQSISDSQIKEMLNPADIERFKSKGLSPNKPQIMGTAQGPSTFFETREAASTYYNNCSKIVSQTMEQFKKLTNRAYKPFEYYGHPNAKHIIVAMGSSIQTIKAYIKANPEKPIGCINVRLYKPFDINQFKRSIPETCSTITVLDRCKEASGIGEPLYMDVCTAINHLFFNGALTQLPKIIGGRYGLSSKEFTINMVEAIYQNANDIKSVNNFAIGIADGLRFAQDDNNSISGQVNFKHQILIEDIDNLYVPSLRNLCLGIKNDKEFIQMYKEFDYAKVNAKSYINVRIDQSPIEAPFNIKEADLFILSDMASLNQNVLKRVKAEGYIVLISKDKESDYIISTKYRELAQKKSISIILVEAGTEMANNQNTIETIIQYWKQSMKIEKNNRDAYLISTINGASILKLDQQNVHINGSHENSLSFNGTTISANGAYSLNDHREDGKYYYDDFSDSVYPTGKYIEMLTDLYGDRLMIANATGESSIVNGNLENLPWYKDENGRGPVWSNSLFEDNAEFGFGFHMALDQKREQALQLLRSNAELLDADLISNLIENPQKTTYDIQNQRLWVDETKSTLKNKGKLSSVMLDMLDYLVNTSLWIIGGDGWAYDIGFGGLDHVLASGENINIMVFDNECYANTGGQASKASRIGAKLGMAFNGKKTRKKKLAEMFLSHDNVYVASVAIGADEQHCREVIKKAEAHQGPSIIIACAVTDYKEIKQSFNHAQRLMVEHGDWELFEKGTIRNKKDKETKELYLIG